MVPTRMGESRQTVAESDVVHLVSHSGDDHLEEEVDRIDYSRGLKGVGMVFSYFKQQSCLVLMACHSSDASTSCSKENKVGSETNTITHSLKK